MGKVIGTAIIVLVLIVGGLAAYIYSGSYYVGADQPHLGVTAWILNKALDRSIDQHAEGIAAPAGLDDRAKIVEGAGHYAEHCVICHAAPGQAAGEIGRGLYPRPPELATATADLNESELFWVIKHGIKMSGMPAWGSHPDDELWAIVAFVRKLPRMKPREYAALIAEAHPQQEQGPPQQSSQQQVPASQTAPGIGSAQPPAALPAAPSHQHRRRH